jgi:hypothetical protein
MGSITKTIDVRSDTLEVGEALSDYGRCTSLSYPTRRLIGSILAGSRVLHVATELG